MLLKFHMLFIDIPIIPDLDEIQEDNALSDINAPK